MAVPNSRFSMAIHSLLVMAAKRDGPVCSDFIAGSVGTNPVLIRRLMGDLREAGLVESRAGSAGGFVLAKDLSEITLDQVYRAVEEAPLFPRHENPNEKCPIGREIGRVLDQLYGAAEGSMMDALHKATLADLAAAASKKPAAD